MSKLAETLGRFNATDIFNIVRQIEPGLGVAWYNLGTANWSGLETRSKAAELFKSAIEKGVFQMS